MAMIAVCSPELHGDVLWSIPAARGLAEKHHCQADFWISRRAQNAADLLAAQSFVRAVHVKDGEWHYGAKDITPDGDYEGVYQFGFRDHIPIRGTLLDYFCEIVGLDRQGVFLDLPPTCPAEPLPVAFVALASKGYEQHPWIQPFRDFVEHCPLSVVEVGQPGTAVSSKSIDRCRWGFLEMAGIISKAKYFLGTISSPLVIADAMPHNTRIAVHDGVHWNLAQCTSSPQNIYYAGYDYRKLLEYVS